jgi:hypothetical protein
MWTAECHDLYFRTVGLGFADLAEKGKTCRIGEEIMVTKVQGFPSLILQFPEKL